jgi:hypothetical protein
MSSSIGWKNWKTNRMCFAEPAYAPSAAPGSAQPAERARQGLLVPETKWLNPRGTRL